MKTPVMYVLVLAVVLCFLAAAITGIVIRDGNIESATPLITSLLGLFAPTIAVLVVIIRQQHNIQDIKETKELVNNHITNDKPAGPST